MNFENITTLLLIFWISYKSLVIMPLANVIHFKIIMEWENNFFIDHCTIYLCVTIRSLINGFFNFRLKYTLHRTIINPSIGSIWNASQMEGGAFKAPPIKTSLETKIFHITWIWEQNNLEKIPLLHTFSLTNRNSCFTSEIKKW